MTLTDRLLATILGTLIAWLIKSFVSHCVKRSRLRETLKVDILLNVAGAKQQRSAVAKLIEDNVKEGETLPFPIAYNVGEYLLYKALQKELPEYLTKAELKKVVKFYNALWELDVSINGLALVLAKWEERSVVLTKEQVSHIQRRRERIDSLCEILSSKDVREIQDLPDDYRSAKGPDTVVGKT